MYTELYMPSAFKILQQINNSYFVKTILRIDRNKIRVSVLTRADVNKVCFAKLRDISNRHEESREKLKALLNGTKVISVE